jgi:hypothetical protein
MDKVAGLADEQYLRITSPWLKDRWQARDEYIHVLLGDESFLDWEMAQALRPLSAPEEQSLARLLTGQFERQRMYTSCGWFFEDFDRIEPCNNIRYAAHALVLTESVCGEELIAGVKGDLKQIRSWRSSLNAEEVFDEAIRRFEENV